MMIPLEWIVFQEGMAECYPRNLKRDIARFYMNLAGLKQAK